MLPKLFASQLQDQAFPFDVRLAGEWRTVHYVSDDRGWVVLWDRDNREIAKVYPFSKLVIREDQ